MARQILHSCMIMGMLAFLAAGSTSYGAAWGNGSYADNPTSYDYATDFGTHDWIAEAAVNALVALNSQGWDWLNQRITICLTGTEAPDNSGLSATLDGVAVSGFGDTASHHIYFNEDGTIKTNEDDAAIRAKSCGDLANAYYIENKLDLAAFYLGAMTHYIGDMAMYSHIAPNNVTPYNLDFDLHHSNVESYTNTRTNNHAEPQEFFHISTISTLDTIAPYDAAKQLAWETYKAESDILTRDAVWLHNNYFSPWNQSYEDRTTDTIVHQQYYSRIEQNLNNAILAVAYAIIERITVSPPSDDSDDSTDPADDDSKVEKKRKITGFPAEIFMLVCMFGVVGRGFFTIRKSTMSA